MTFRGELTMNPIKRALIYFALAGLCYLIIYIMAMSKPYTCYFCEQTKRGRHYKATLLRIERDICPECYSRNRYWIQIQNR